MPGSAEAREAAPAGGPSGRGCAGGRGRLCWRARCFFSAIGGRGLVWAALRLAAALFFLGYGVQRLWPPLRRPRRGTEGRWARRLGALARPLFARPLGWRGYALGVGLGL